MDQQQIQTALGRYLDGDNRASFYLSSSATSRGECKWAAYTAFEILVRELRPFHSPRLSGGHINRVFIPRWSLHYSSTASVYVTIPGVNVVVTLAVLLNSGSTSWPKRIHFRGLCYYYPCFPRSLRTLREYKVLQEYTGPGQEWVIASCNNEIGSFRLARSLLRAEKPNEAVSNFLAHAPEAKKLLRLVPGDPPRVSQSLSLDFLTI